MKIIGTLAALSLLAISCTPKAAVTSWSAEETALILKDSAFMRVLTIEAPSDSLLLRRSSTDMSAADLSSAEYAELSAKLVATVTSPEQDGVGIAGPQVGILRRVVAVQRLDREEEPFEVYPNIRIVAKRGDLEYGPEGCLSVPDMRGNVPRYRDIDITYTSVRTFKDTTETITGFTAVIFQHECDHLDGIIYTDRADKVDKIER